MNAKLIKIKSEELDIPFAQVLSGGMLEGIVTMIYEKPYYKQMWLCNDEVLGIDAYKRKTGLFLDYKYVGTQSVKAFADEFSEDCRQYLSQRGCHVKNIGQTTQKNAIRLTFALSIEEMYVPLQIDIEKIEPSHGFPVEKSFSLMMENNRNISMMTYPTELSLAYHLSEIIKQLELINDMQHYIRVYDILKKRPVEARKVKDALDALCDEKGISKTEKPLILWKSYRTYGYMKKKWKVLLRQEKIKEPAWEEVFDLTDKFLSPIWEAVWKEEIFFGDWMPELERFLD